jgi:prephenate dehydratase
VAGAAKVAYLGPKGTFSEEALLATVREEAVEPVEAATIYEAVIAVQQGELPYALVPIENSLEGPVTVTLDTLAGEAAEVRIIAETVLPIRHCLLAKEVLPLDRYRLVLSHPQAAGQCSGFLRSRLPGAAVRHRASTAEAVREVAGLADREVAAIGNRRAAELYGVQVVAEGIEDGEFNETRFVWLARGDLKDPPPWRNPPAGDAPRKTSVVFWGAGAERPGWLVSCLLEFANRGINLTKIESRPRKERLGHYMFFADLEGGTEEPAVQDALAGLGSHCEEVKVLGSYPRV